jgi:hypothetical protein
MRKHVANIKKSYFDNFTISIEIIKIAAFTCIPLRLCIPEQGNNHKKTIHMV